MVTIELLKELESKGTEKLSIILEIYPQNERIKLDIDINNAIQIYDTHGIDPISTIINQGLTELNKYK